MDLIFVRSFINLDDIRSKIDQLLAKSSPGSVDRIVLVAEVATIGNRASLSLRSADGSLPLELVILAGTLSIVQAVPEQPARVDFTGRDEAPGGKVTVLARRLAGPLVIDASGGPGRPGLDGSIAAVEGFDPDRKPPVYWTFEVELPGDGTDGGSGGVLRCMTVEGDGPVGVAFGGRGGSGGSVLLRGFPNPRPPRFPQVPNVPPGKDGANGPTGTADVQRVDDAAFFSGARVILGQDAIAAASRHLYRTADVLFRRMGGRVRGGDAADQRQRILGLLGLVDGLRGGGDAEVAGMREALIHGDLATGRPRLDTVKLWIDWWRTQHDSLAGPVAQSFAATREVALASVVTDGVLTALAQQAHSLRSTMSDARAQVDIAKLRLLQAQNERNHAATKFSEAQIAVENRINELPIEDAKLIVEGVLVVAAAVVSFVASIYTGGTAAVALVPALLKLIPSVVTLVGAVEASTGGSSALLKGMLSKDAPKVDDLVKLGAKEVGPEDLNKKSEELLKGTTGLFIQITKFALSIENASGDAKLKGLMKAQVEAAYAAALKQAELTAATLVVAAAESRVARLTDDIETLERAIGATSSGNVLQRETILSLLAATRARSEILLDLRVSLARAVELFTLSDQSNTINLDHGFPDPDIEADFRDGLIDAAAFQRALVQATVDDGGVGRLMQAYRGYLSATSGPGLQPTQITFVIEDPALLARMGVERRLDASFLLGDVEARSATILSDIKLVGVGLTLQGVRFPGAPDPQPGDPTLAWVIAHGGVASQRDRLGAIVSEVYDATSGIVNLGRPVGTSDVLQGTTRIDWIEATPGNDFYGRGVAANYSISFDNEDVPGFDIDLSALRKLSITFHVIARSQLPARLKITFAKRDADGRTTWIGGSAEEGGVWSIRADRAIDAILRGLHSFEVEAQGAPRAEVVVHARAKHLYLTTTRDQTKVNNLDELPQRQGIEGFGLEAARLRR